MAAKKKEEEPDIEGAIALATMPEPEDEPDEVQTSSLFDVGIRQNCSCGEKMVRRKGKGGKWNCIRVVTGNDPTSSCNRNVAANKIVSELPVRKKEVDED